MCDNTDKSRCIFRNNSEITAKLHIQLQVRTVKKGATMIIINYTRSKTDTVYNYVQLCGLCKEKIFLRFSNETSK